MKRTDPQYKLRIPEAMKARIEEAAKANNRSMNAEIVARLEDSLEQRPEAGLIHGTVHQVLASLVEFGGLDVKTIQEAAQRVEKAMRRTKN